MGLQGGQPGRADYYEHGSFNVACSLCGRKRKFFQVEKNWQGLYRCPEHNEPRHPQDFVRSVPDIMSVPYTLSLNTAYTSLTATFPLSIFPSPVVLYLSATIDLMTQSGQSLYTQSGIDITLETVFVATVGIIVPNWVQVETVAWSVMGGTNKLLDSSGNQIYDSSGNAMYDSSTSTALVLSAPNSAQTLLLAVGATEGTLNVTVTDTLGGTASASTTFSCSTVPTGGLTDSFGASVTDSYGQTVSDSY